VFAGPYQFSPHTGRYQALSMPRQRPFGDLRRFQVDNACSRTHFCIREVARVGLTEHEGGPLQRQAVRFTRFFRFAELDRAIMKRWHCGKRLSAGFVKVLTPRWRKRQILGVRSWVTCR